MLGTAWCLLELPCFATSWSATLYSVKILAVTNMCSSSSRSASSSSAWSAVLSEFLAASASSVKALSICAALDVKKISSEWKSWELQRRCLWLIDLMPGPTLRISLRQPRTAGWSSQDRCGTPLVSWWTSSTLPLHLWCPSSMGSSSSSGELTLSLH